MSERIVPTLVSREMKSNIASRQCEAAVLPKKIARLLGYQKLVYSGTDHVDIRFEPIAGRKQNRWGLETLLQRTRTPSLNKRKSPIPKSENRAGSVYSLKDNDGKSNGIIRFLRRYRGSV